MVINCIKGGEITLRILLKHVTLFDYYKIMLFLYDRGALKNKQRN